MCVSSNCFLYTFTNCSAFATLRLLFHVVSKHASCYLPSFLHYSTRKYFYLYYFFLFNCFLLAVSQHELSSLMAYVVMSQPQRHSFNKHVRTYTHTKHKCLPAYRCVVRTTNFFLEGKNGENRNDGRKRASKVPVHHICAPFVLYCQTEKLLKSSRIFLLLNYISYHFVVDQILNIFLLCKQNN